MMSKIAALIPASGEGRRLGKGPKAFLKLGAKTILELTINCFLAEVDEIIVAVSSDMLGQAKQYQNSKTKIITGGESRQETVHKLLKATKADFVLIHDAARPFLATEIIKASIAELKTHKAAMVVKPVADSLIDKKTKKNVDRDELLAVQTPQSFRRKIILEAHEYALKQNITATDDASLVRLLGYEVALIEGSSWFDKITNLADYERAQALAEVWDDC